MLTTTASGVDEVIVMPRVPTEMFSEAVALSVNEEATPVPMRARAAPPIAIVVMILPSFMG